MDESLLLGLYSADGMQKVDGLAIHGIGIPGGHLMERAGLAVATEILERYAPEEAVVFAGKGNNGGDGFVVARELFDAGCEVTVFLLASPDEYQGDARLNLDILGRLGVDVRPATGEGGVLSRGHDDAHRAGRRRRRRHLRHRLHRRGQGAGRRGHRAHQRGPRRRRQRRHHERRRRQHRRGARAGRGRRPHRDPCTPPRSVHFVTPGGALSGEVVIAPIGIPTLCDQDPTCGC